MTIDLSGTRIPADRQSAVDAFCDALSKQLGDKLLTVTLYGSGARDDFSPTRSDVNLLIVASELDAVVLPQLSKPFQLAHRKGISPFLLTKTELERSTDIFPLKFMSMKESHRVLVGQDVLGALPLSREHIRLRCEQELMNLLLRLRRQYLVPESHELDRVMARTVGGFVEELRIALTLTGAGLPTRAEAPEVAGRRIGFDPAALQRVLALRDSDQVLPKQESEALFSSYLEIVSRAARFVDSVDQQS